MQTGTRQPPISPRVKFRGVPVCFDRFGLFRLVCVIRPKYFFGFLFIYFFLSFHLTGLKSLLNFDLSFFFAPSSSSSSFFFFLFSAQLFLYNFSLLFFFWLFAKKKKKEWFLVQVPCPSSFFLLLLSSFFFFFFLLLLSFFRPGLSLYAFSLFFFFFSFWFKCRPSRDVIRYLFEIFIAFALWRVMHSLFFFFFFFI
jgi:hypothetical protein